MTTDIIVVHCLPRRCERCGTDLLCSTLQALVCELWVVTWHFCIVRAVLGCAVLALGGGRSFCVVVGDGGGQGGMVVGKVGSHRGPW